MTTQPAATPDDIPQLEGELERARRAEVSRRRVYLIVNAVFIVAGTGVAGYLLLHKMIYDETLSPKLLFLIGGLSIIVNGALILTHGILKWREAAITHRLRHLQLPLAAAGQHQTEFARILDAYVRLEHAEIILIEVAAISMMLAGSSLSGIALFDYERLYAVAAPSFSVLILLIPFSIGIGVLKWHIEKRARPIYEVLEQTQQTRHT